MCPGLFPFCRKLIHSTNTGERCHGWRPTGEPFGRSGPGCHNRKVLNSSFAIGRRAQKWDACDENLKSLAHMAAVSLVGCSFCLDLGYFMAHNEGLDEAKAREVPCWRESTIFTPLERDVMEYAEAMTQTPPRVTDKMSAWLLEQLGPAALVELTTFVGLANLYSRTNTAFGIESQGFSAACDLRPLAGHSTA
jgi:alkylhydroperoxidase family enzyme